MSNPWMPFYVGDYLADTALLTTRQHGAYLLLIMHYWRKGGLPHDEAQLARIAKLSPRIWANERAVLQEFFRDGWTHPRIDREIARAARITEKRAHAGARGAAALAQARTNTDDKSLISQEATPANARQSPGKAAANGQYPQPQSQSQSQSQRDQSRSDAHARGASMLTYGSKARAAAFLEAIGFELATVPPEFAGVDIRAVEWEAAGWGVDMIAAEARRIGASKPLTYHEKVFATTHARLHAPLPKVEIRESETATVVHAKPHVQHGVVAAARRFADHFAQQPAAGVAPDRSVVLRLSKG